MNKTITNKDEYMHMCNVRNYPMTYDNKMEREFFGHKVILEKNKWQWHLQRVKMQIPRKAHYFSGGMDSGFIYFLRKFL